jgi:hypothetical protein
LAEVHAKRPRDHPDDGGRRDRVALEGIGAGEHILAILPGSQGSESRKRWVMRKPYVKLSVSGMGSGALYALLYAYEEEVMFAFTRTDGWYPLLPVLGAFVVSFVHGAFAAYFWEVLGITARREKT